MVAWWSTAFLLDLKLYSLLSLALPPFASFPLPVDALCCLVYFWLVVYDHSMDDDVDCDVAITLRCLSFLLYRY